MERYNGQVLVKFDDPTSGNAFANASVTVRDYFSNLIVPIFENDTGTPKANPFLSDENGIYHFYAEPGRYNIVIQEGNPDELTIRDVQLGALLPQLPQRQTINPRDFIAARDEIEDEQFAITWGDAIGELLGPLILRGTWNADANEVNGDPLNTELVKGQAPNSPEGLSADGYTYIVNVAGLFDLTDEVGAEDWQVDDKAIWNGVTWIRIPGSAVNIGLDELNDVTLTEPQNQDVLEYNEITEQWENSGSQRVQDTRLDTLETNDTLQDERLDTLEADVQETKIDEIRYSKLDNPITHLFKKNKLVSTLQGELSWQRDSAATYVDRYGVVRYSPSNVGANDLFYSQDFGQAAWTKVRSSIDSNVAVAPDGTITADKHVEDNSSNTHFIQQPVFNTEANAAVALSVFCKAAERTNVVIQGMTAANWAERPNAVFDLSAGTVTETVSGSATIAPLGNGWYRCTAAGMFGPSIADGGISVFTAIDGNSNYQGDGVSGIYVWGAQGEISRVANAYVRTTDDPKAGIQTGFGIDQSREESAGWLIEGESTNYLTDSEHTIRAVGGSDPVKNGPFPAPDLATSAYSCSGSIGSGSGNNPSSGNRFNSTALIDFGGVAITSSVFVKAVTQTAYTTYLFFLNNELGIEVRLTLDFDAGRLVNTLFEDTSGSPTNTSYTVSEELQDGWYYVSMTMDSQVGEYTYRLAQHAGSIAGDETMWWGTTIEPLPFASSYIPTTDAAVTRAADDVTIQGDFNIPRLSDSHSITSNVNFIGYQTIGLNRYIFAAVTDNNINFDRSISTFSGGDDLLQYYDGVNLGLIVSNASMSKPFFLSTTYDQVTQRLAISVNGGEFEREDPNITFDSTNDIVRTIYLGKSLHPDGFRVEGHLLDFRIYDFALSDAEIKFLAGE